MGDTQRTCLNLAKAVHAKNKGRLICFISNIFVGSHVCAANHYVIAEKCPVCPIFGDVSERRLRVR